MKRLLHLVRLMLSNWATTTVAPTGNHTTPQALVRLGSGDYTRVYKGVTDDDLPKLATRRTTTTNSYGNSRQRIRGRAFPNQTV